MLKLFSNNPIYIRITQDEMTARSVKSKKEYYARSLVALDGKKSFINGSLKLLAVGDEALTYEKSHHPVVKVMKVFTHPRFVGDDYEVATAILRHLVDQVVSRPKIVRPFLVIQPLEDTAAGITAADARALREAGESAGARKVLVWVGRELTDHELENLQFPEGQGKLFESAPVQKSFRLSR